MIESVLVDNRNFDQVEAELRAGILASTYIGIDLETQDDARHEGLNRLCGYDPVTRKKPDNKKLVFDMRRTVVCGLSLYSEELGKAYYFNLNHADTANRLPWEKLKALLDLKPAKAWWVAHNATFEITVMRNCYGYELDPSIIDTLQMCVSAYGPDTYSEDDWLGIGQGQIGTLVPDLIRESLTGLLDTKEMRMSPALSDTVYKVISKTSDAAHSYNGLVKQIAFGYGLKQAVASHFGYQMTTFQECLRGRAHMGELTGAEVAEYGADDAYWAIRLFRFLLGYMAQNGGEQLIRTFLTQENPMAAIYSGIWRGGLKVDAQAIEARRELERETTAEVLRTMKKAILKCLPFLPEPYEPLLADKWYKNGYAKYRARIEAWAHHPDMPTAYEEVRLVAGAVSNAWGDDEGEDAKSIGPNLSHYMPVRTIIYDLLQQKPVKHMGKIQSNGEARAKIRDRLTDQNQIDVIDGLAKLAGIEQRMKLYLTPYTQLTDPETDRLYPIMTSTLATRRMSCSSPNGQQLAKRGDSTYVREFFQADYDDHVIVSEDFSAVELVAIGEASGDPEFVKAFGQIPHEDLHSGAAAAILSVEVPDLTDEQFKSFKKLTAEDAKHLHPRLITDLKGRPIPHDGVYKYWRTEVGKGANFEFWFSNWLSTVGEKMGWTQETVGKAVERYTDRFRVAADWRSNLVSQVQKDGHIFLPDGHRYVRYEATNPWFYQWLAKFPIKQEHSEFLANYRHIIEWMGRKIQKRGFNQTVNARIQGHCASLAKRSAIRIGEQIKANGWTEREVRPMLFVHDELIYSVHRDLVAEFVPMMWEKMTNHPDWFSLCKLDAAPSIGFNFAPWTQKSRLGQLELFELPESEFGPVLAKKRVMDKDINQVVDWLFEERARHAA